MRVNFGLSHETIEQIADQLKEVLGNHAVLYVKTLNCHWNMEGPRFYPFHLLLQEQYEALAEFLDEVAERIRQMGVRAPGSLQAFLKLSTLEEIEEELSTDEMIEELARSHEAMILQLREAIAFADKQGDPATADMLIKLLGKQEKMAWLLRSHL